MAEELVNLADGDIAGDELEGSEPKAPSISPYEAELASAKATHELIAFAAEIRDSGREVTGDDLQRLDRLEARAEARAEALEAVVASRAASAHDEKVLEGMERPEQQLRNAQYDSMANKHWKEIFENAVDPQGPKVPVAVEYRPPQVMPSPSNSEFVSIKFNSIKVSDSHYIEQKLIALPRDMYEAATEEHLAPKDGKMVLQGARDGNSSYRVVPFDLQGATTSGQNLFPSLTRFMPDVQHTIDAVAPMISGGHFDVLATPGDTSTIRYEQIVQDPAPGLATEGTAVAESDLAWNQVDLGCFQIDENFSYTRWAEWNAFIRNFPRQMNRTVVKGLMRKVNEYATTGTGTNQPFGLVTAVDALTGALGTKGGAGWSSADYTVTASAAATNPFTPLHLADMQDMIDDGAEAMGNCFFMSHKRTFGDMRKALYTANIGVNDIWLPYYNQTGRDARRNIYGEFWGSKAVNNREFSRDFNTAGTTTAVYVEGDSFTLRYLPMITWINAYRLSDSRRIAIEATAGLDAAFTTSPGHDGFFVTRARTA